MALTHPVAGAVTAAAQQHGLIVNAANERTVRLAPPLIIGDVEIDEFARLFAAALATAADALLLEDQPAAASTPEKART
ncbi:acetylornithine/succinyldiaminopimelate/putrescine aminotransferase [Microbacterium sp. SORGH_AS 888]|nr:acetylornithine/succinyldiaminopimelate/putrescine aminotransferase [Microbacterium sp. SORGH_AS_0888]